MPVKTFTVKLRRDLEVREEAEIIDGYTGPFERGWLENDGIYKGEFIWVPVKKDWPTSAIKWVAEGDLIER